MTLQKLRSRHYPMQRGRMAPRPGAAAAAAAAVLTLILVLTGLAPGVAGARLAAEPAAGGTDSAVGASSRPLATPETLPARLPAMPPAAAPADADTGAGSSFGSTTGPEAGAATPAGSGAGNLAEPAVAGEETAAAAPGTPGAPGAPGGSAGGAASPAAAAPADGVAPAAAMADPADPEALARAYRRTGNAALVQVGDRGAAILIPFGHGRPVLRCAPLRACAVELDPGELVLATSLGDGERWLVQSAAAGPGAHTPLLVVKPTACDLSTNLVVATDGRIYELALDSPPCRGADAGESGAYNPHLPYTGLVRFYYPDDLVRRWTDQERLARQQAAELATGRTPLAPAARLARLNFDYAWDRSRRWPWVPSQVFDDGEHT